jgi:hypothetical protein
LIKKETISLSMPRISGDLGIINYEIDEINFQIYNKSGGCNLFNA